MMQKKRYNKKFGKKEGTPIMRQEICRKKDATRKIPQKRCDKKDASPKMQQ
jgi:hypothetical protein